MELAKHIKERRAQLGMSQEELAEAIIVSRQTISNWETDRTYPDVANERNRKAGRMWRGGGSLRRQLLLPLLVSVADGGSLALLGDFSARFVRQLVIAV